MNGLAMAGEITAIRLVIWMDNQLSQGKCRVNQNYSTKILTVLANNNMGKDINEKWAEHFKLKQKCQNIYNNSLICLFCCEAVEVVVVVVPQPYKIYVVVRCCGKNTLLPFSYVYLIQQDGWENIETYEEFDIIMKTFPSKKFLFLIILLTCKCWYCTFWKVVCICA